MPLDKETMVCAVIALEQYRGWTPEELSEFITLTDFVREVRAEEGKTDIDFRNERLVEMNLP